MTSAVTTTANALVGYKVGNIYRIGTKIGSGSFGEIHKGKKSPCILNRKKRVGPTYMYM
jgi:hypothetical protein